jgi:hypothetical protein
LAYTNVSQWEAEGRAQPRDLEAVAEVVSRLRLDGHVMDMATFEALMLRGQSTAPPRLH